MYSEGISGPEAGTLQQSVFVASMEYQRTEALCSHSHHGQVEAEQSQTSRHFK